MCKWATLATIRANTLLKVPMLTTSSYIKLKKDRNLMGNAFKLSFQIQAIPVKMMKDVMSLLLVEFQIKRVRDLED